MMKKIMMAGVVCMLFSVNCYADEAYKFSCELDERVSDHGTFKETYKYVIEKNSEISETNFEKSQKYLTPPSQIST